MSTAKLQKYVNLALNNSSEGEASTAARMFFKKLRSLDMRFNSKSWGLTGEQARKLMELGGVQIKGAKSKTEPKETPDEVQVNMDAGPRTTTLKEVLEGLDIEPSKARRILRKVFGKRGSWLFTYDEAVEARATLIKYSKKYD